MTAADYCVDVLTLLHLHAVHVLRRQQKPTEFPLLVLLVHCLAQLDYTQPAVV